LNMEKKSAEIASEKNSKNNREKISDAIRGALESSRSDTPAQQLEKKRVK